MISVLGSVSIPPEQTTLATALWMGALASLNACAVARLPVLATFVAGAGTSKRHALTLTILFALGFVGGTVLLGLMATPLADGVHKTLQVDKHLFWVLGLCLVMAGILISGFIDLQLVSQRWQHLGQRLGRADLPGALLLGVGLGLLHTPACPTCRAELLMVAAGGAVGASSFYGLVLLVGFAVGQSLVAMGVGVLVALLRPSLFQWLRTRMCSIEQRFQLFTGDLLMVLGIYFVLVG